MNNIRPAGLFGKLPAHGDFIYRNLPTHFINLWDSWLQGFVSGSQEQIGDNWLDIYLTSPIWRFVLSAGVIDENNWIGILLPSVDRVGRYFPFSVACPLSPSLTPAEILEKNTGWFEAMEKAALGALEGTYQIEDLILELNKHKVAGSGRYRRQDSASSQTGAVIKMEFEEQAPVSVLPHFVDSLLKESLSSYSIWCTRGSQYVDPCVFYSPGLPQRRGIAAMLDGQWAGRDWHEPLRLQTTPSSGGTD